MDKTKFTINPQLDAEGFTLPAGCHADCTNDDLIHVCQLSGGTLTCQSAHRVLQTGTAMWTDSDGHHRVAPTCGGGELMANPKGWQEVDGVVLPSVSPWAKVSQSDLDAVHAIWSKSDGR